MNQVSSGTEINGTKYIVVDYTIKNIPDYINPNNSRHTIAFTTYNGTESSLNHLHVLPARPGPAPSSVDYDATAHKITGLNSLMEFSYDGGYNWWNFASGSNISFNLYPYLSKTSTTDIEVRYPESATAPASKSWTYTVSSLDPAPTGLYIDWYNDAPALRGLDATRYYAISNTTDFATYSYVNPGPTAVLLDSTLTAGKVVYVRSAANIYASSSAYVALTVPSKPVIVPPATQYDNTQHHLFGLNADMDLRISSGGSWTDWLQIPSNGMYLNAYSYLSTAASTQIQVRYRNTPSAVQTITVPALSAAPSGMSLEWVSGYGLVLWGLQGGYHYNLWYDSYFDDWYAIDASSSGLIVDSLGLQPGDPFYVRYAPNSSSAQSACVELVVPSMSAQAASAEVATSGVTSGNQRDSAPAIEEIQNETAFTPNGEEFVPDEAVASDITADNEVQARASRQAATELVDEPVFGELVEFTPESSGALIVSAEKVLSE